MTGIMEDTLRAVIAGCGGISRAWLNAIRDIPALEMVGFVDLLPEAAQARADEYGWTSAIVGSDLSAMLSQTSPDVVFDCTVPEAHVDVVITALGRGCHVLGEKPLADSMANARRMVQAAGESGKTYAVMQNRRFDANIRRLRDFVGSGAIGRVTTVTSDFYIGAHFGGFRDRMRHVLLVDMAIHTFDAARFISGADPLTATCVEWNPPGSWYDHDASAIATFEMSEGIVYNYRGSWCSEGLSTTWESDWRIIGTNGSVSWDGAEGLRAEVVKGPGGFLSEMADLPVPPLKVDLPATGHAGLIRDFVERIQRGETPGTVCYDNIKSLAMVFGAIESAEKRCTVPVD
jgi:predicted dehydrogenase